MIKNALYLACFYDPMGNDMSEYPYFKGDACSKCLEGQTCDDGLCTGPACEDKAGDAKCAGWKWSCVDNAAYMKKNCRKTCGHC
ncbi:Hypothetical predicted protein [Mytilus galloprovincialis]|uniref:ShKT domain-containing protein n=1 Tax=Mytilus galloprovincialis TaxID=29158 RepID=A0A8B6GFN7_MYTGA|nr:Hypothetical predicted protein [Mytilus galloprovincialis]